MEGSGSIAVTQKSGVNIESLPQELLDAVFDYVRLDRIAEKLPQLKEPICPAFLDSIRRNLYRNIVLKSHASFMELVESVVNGPPQLGRSIVTLRINGPEVEIPYAGEIQTDSTIGAFVARVDRIQKLDIDKYPLLARFILTPFSVARLSNVGNLELGEFRLAPGSTRTLASYFGEIHSFRDDCYFALEYIPEEASDRDDDEESGGSEDDDQGARRSSVVANMTKVMERGTVV